MIPRGNAMTCMLKEEAGAFVQTKFLGKESTPPVEIMLLEAEMRVFLKQGIQGLKREGEFDINRYLGTRPAGEAVSGEKLKMFGGEEGKECLVFTLDDAEGGPPKPAKQESKPVKSTGTYRR